MNIWRSYRQKYSGMFFDSQCILEIWVFSTTDQQDYWSFQLIFVFVEFVELRMFLLLVLDNVINNLIINNHVISREWCVVQWWNWRCVNIDDATMTQVMFSWTTRVLLSTRSCSTTHRGSRLSLPDDHAPVALSLYELSQDSTSLSLYAGQVYYYR